MGVIYKLLELPPEEKKKFLYKVIRQEANEKIQNKTALQNKSGK